MNLNQVRTMTARAELDADGYTKGAAEKVAADQKMVASDKAVAGAMEATERRIGSKVTGLERLRRAVDPAYDAQRRLEQGTRTLNRGLEQGRITADEHSRAMLLLQQRYGAVGTASAGAAGSMSRLAMANDNMLRATNAGADSSRRFGSAIQNAGFQIGDFAVQVASGQGVLRPLIQQGTQLISMFGPWGAVIGAAGAVAGALATTLFDLGKNTDDASKSLVSYKDALEGAEALTRTSVEHSRAMAEAKRREAVERVQLALAVEQETVARVNQARALLDADEARIRDEQRFLPQTAQTTFFGEPRRRLAEMEREAQDRAMTLGDQIGRLMNPAPDSRIAIDLAGGSSRAPRENNAFPSLMADIDRMKEDLQRKEFAGLMSDIDAMKHARAPFNAAADTIDSMGVDLAMMQRMNAAQLQGADAIQKVQIEEQKLAFARRMGARSLEEMTPEVENLTDQYGDLIKRQMDLKKEIDRDPWKGAKAAATSYFDNLQNLGARTGSFLTRSVFSPLEDSLTNFFTTGKITASSFFDSLKSGLARLAAQDVISAVGRVVGLGSGSASGSLIGAGVSAVGSWIGGLFADGGRPPVGKWSVVGERGPELVKFDSPGTVFSNEQSAAMLRASNDNLAALGRNGDTLVAHINPMEARLLKAMGGSGTRNPRTGLLEFFADGAGFGPGEGFGDYSSFGDPSFSSGAGADQSPAGAAIGGWTGWGGSGQMGMGGSEMADQYAAMAAYNNGNYNQAYSLAMGTPLSFWGELADTLGISTPEGVGFFGSSFFGNLLSAALSFIFPGLGPVGKAAASVAIDFTRSALTEGKARTTGIAGAIGSALSDIATGRSSFTDAMDALGQSAVSSLNDFFGLHGNTGYGSTGSFSGDAFGGASFGGFDVLTAMTTPGEVRQQEFYQGLGANLSGLQAGLAANYQPVLATSRGIMASLPGFANGGRFTVGGMGGTDSVVPRFRATPGEVVDIKTPGQLKEQVDIAMRHMNVSAEAGSQMIGLLRQILAQFDEQNRLARLRVAA